MNALIVTGAGAVTVAPNADAVAFRDAQIEEARKIAAVKSPADMAAAKLAVQGLKQLARDAERHRVEVKAEPLRITKEIDRVASEYTAPIQIEIDRIERAANGFAKEQARLQQEAEDKARAAREAEEKRIDEELQAEKRRLREQQEQMQREQPATRPSFAAARALLQAQQAEQAAEERAEQERAQAAHQTAVVAPAVALKTEWKWRLVDALALAVARPDLVTITPSVRAINNLVVGGLRELPGVQIYEEVRAKL